MERKLWLVSCVHLGEKGHDAPLFAEYLTWAKREGVDIALLGDVCDNGVCFGTKHVGSVWENALTPAQQLDAAVDALMPLRKQIRVVVAGNHDLRTENITSLNTARLLAQRLDAPYSRASRVLSWCGKNIFVAHGSSSALLPDFKKVLDAFEGLDVIALAHVHHLFQQSIRRWCADKAGKLTERQILLVRTGNFLRDAAYAQMALHPPTDLGSAILTWDGKKLRCRLGL